MSDVWRDAGTESAGQGRREGSEDPGLAHAPDYAAPASTGDTLGPDRFEGRVPVALFFCGADDPHVQLKLLRSLSDELEEFGHRRVQLLAVVPWDAERTRRAAREERLQVPMLADPDGQLRDRFGTVDAEGAATTFVIDVHGEIAGVVRQPVGAPHASAVLQRIDVLKQQEPQRMAPLTSLADSAASSHDSPTKHRAGREPSVAGLESGAWPEPGRSRPR